MKLEFASRRKNSAIFDFVNILGVNRGMRDKNTAWESALLDRGYAG